MSSLPFLVVILLLSQAWVEPCNFPRWLCERGESTPTTFSLIYHESTSASTTIIYHTVILICPHPHQYTPTCPLFQITFCKFKTRCFHSKVREAFNPYSVLELTAGDVGEVSWVFLNLSDDDRSGQRRTGMRMKLIIIIMHGDGKGNGHQTHHI